MNFGPLITAMVTPFNEKLEIDWETTGRLIDYLIEDQKSDALVITGTTGESPTLTDDEKIALYRFAVKRAAGRVKIIAGTGTNDTANSVQLTKAAEEAGADGILLVAPYYNKPTQEGLYLHFKTIAESTKLPAMVYNVPSRTVTSISVETTLKLAQIPNIVATKECASIEQITEIVRDAPEGFRVYTGDDPVTLPALSVGAVGVVSVASHVVGSRMKDMIEAFEAGNVKEAARINQELYPVFKGLFNCPHPVPNPVPVKYALTLRGIPVGGVRLPLANITEQEAAFVRNLMS